MHNTSLFEFPRINLQHLLKSDPDYKQPLYLDCEQQAVQEPPTQARSNDLVDLHLATIATMICQRLNSEQHNDLLPKLFN